MRGARKCGGRNHGANKSPRKNYNVPDLVVKVTGKVQVCRGFSRGRLIFAKLLLNLSRTGACRRSDASAALAMPGVKAVLTEDDPPKPSPTRSTTTARGSPPISLANSRSRIIRYIRVEPILAVSAVDEVTAAEAIEKIQIDFEPLPFLCRSAGEPAPRRS